MVDAQLLHPELDCLDGVGRIYRIMSILVHLDQGRQDIKSVILRQRTIHIHKRLNAGESFGVVLLGMNWPNTMFAYHHTFSALILPYFL